MKNKSILSIVITAIVISITFSSCTSGDNAVKYIPSESLFVGVVDLPQMGIKSKLYKNETFAFIENVIDMTEESQEVYSTLLRGIIKDNNTSGINVYMPLYAYMEQESKYNCIVVSLSDNVAFSDYLEGLLSDTFTKAEKDNIIIYTDEQTSCIAFNEDVALFISIDNYSTEFVVDLFNIQEENTITENDEFLAFMDDAEDISLFAPTSHLLALDKSIEKELSSSISLLGDYTIEDIRDSYITLTIAFNSDNINTSIQVYGDEDFDALVSENSFAKNNFSDDILSFLPEQTLFFMASTYDSEKLMSYIQKIDTKENFLSVIEKNGISIEPILKNFDGDFALSFYDIVTEEMEVPDRRFVGFDDNGRPQFIDTVRMRTVTMPKISAAFSLSESSSIQNLIDIFGENYLQKVDSYYILKQSPTMGIKTYVSLTKDILLISTDKEAIDNVENGGFDDSFSSTSIAKNISPAGYMFVNLDYNNYPEGLTNMAEKMGVEKIITDVSPLLQSLEVRSNDEMSSSIIIHLKEKDNNSLYQVLETIDNFSGI
ncbi:MAG: DUF4836 family protein [Bacteroidales bacterium]|jgi:hypothetical protein|nr:DUF4836 family protein [Bacteroidales bacterium]